MRVFSRALSLVPQDMDEATFTMARPRGQAETWQLALQNTKERLQYLYTSGEHTDLELALPECEETFKVHRLVLIMSSPVFEVMLTGSMAVEKELTLYEDSPQAIRRLLDYMYMDCMDLESVDEALEVYAAAHKYQLDAARAICSEYIVANLTEEKTLAALEASLLYEDPKMNKKCNELLMEKPDDVMGADCVTMLKKETLRNLLQSQDLEVSSEVVLLDAIITWGKAQLYQREEESCSSALRKETEDLLKEVRFMTLSSEEFIDKVVDKNIFSHTECIQILKCIRGANVSSIPESTPLNPSAIRRRKTVLKADLGEVRKCDELYVFEADMVHTLLSEITTTKDILIYQIESDIPGLLLQIEDESGSVTKSHFNNRVTTFREPFVMKRNKKYCINGIFQSDTEARYSLKRDLFTTTVGDVSISYQNEDIMNFKLYFTRL